MKFIGKVFDETLTSHETYKYKEFLWELGDKMEYDMYVFMEKKIIPFENVRNIKLIFIETDAPVRIVLETDRVISSDTDFILNESSGKVDVEFDDVFIFTPTLNMQDSLVEISIESPWEANVSISVYGENLES